MKIQSLTLSQVQINQMCRNDLDGVTHKKSLSCFSVVESLTGTYRIRLDGGAPLMTVPGGFFVAAPQTEQIITHFADPGDGVFRARWLFFNVTVNNVYPLESLCEFPVICPEDYRDELHGLLDGVFAAASDPDLYARVMAAVSLLIKTGRPKPEPIPEMIAVQQYLHSHYDAPVCVEDLTRLVSVSPAALYQKFKSAFGISPIAYLNRYRLGQACLLLEKTDHRIDDIAYAVGFSDPLYFSRLFKKEYGVSPRKYREFIST